MIVMRRTKRLAPNGRRNGFSLVEVMIALVILAIAVLGIQGVAGNMLGMLGTSERRALAMRMAEDKIGEVRLEQNYANLASYAGTDSVPAHPGFKRVTTVQQFRNVMQPGGGIEDYKRISVVVTAPGLKRTIIRSITKGAP